MIKYSIVVCCYGKMLVNVAVNVRDNYWLGVCVWCGVCVCVCGVYVCVCVCVCVFVWCGVKTIHYSIVFYHFNNS
jgi:hypothetical protein